MNGAQFGAMLDARKTFRADDPLRALGISRPALAVNDAVHEEIAARLMDGEAADRLVGDMVRTHGLAAAEALRLVQAAADHPYVRAAARLRARVSKRDWLLECRARLERDGEEAIPRRHRLAADIFYAEHYRPLRPVVLTGLVDDWPAMGWSFDRLAARIPGDPEIEVQGDREADPDFELNSIAHKRRMRWRAVLAAMQRPETGNSLYVTANNSGVNRQALAQLWADIGPLPGYLGPSPMGDGFFWMGPQGSITPWHHDLTQNLLMTCSGTKRVTLVAPHETQRMQNHRHCFSRFAADAALASVPQDERPRLWQVDIAPGEILFLPVGWWHHVEGLTPTIGMSFTNFVWPNDFGRGYSSFDRV